MQFWIKFTDGSAPIWLPVNPDSIRVMSTHNYEDVQVAQLGERTIIGEGALRTFTFSSFFPRDYNASYCEHDRLEDPWLLAQRIEQAQSSGNPARLIITGTPINVTVTIRTFTYREEGGAVGDIYYDIELKEYRYLTFAKYEGATAAVAKFTAPTTSAARTSAARTTPATYTVKSGDTLWKIAQRVYSDGDKWRKIYDANKKAVGPNPNALKVGVTLAIPS